MMQKVKSVVFFALAALIFWFWLEHASPITVQILTPSSFFPIRFYTPRDLQLGISSYPPSQCNPDTSPTIKGGVVSHHLLAQREIARYFQNLSKYCYDRVILLGPNHGDLGNDSFLSASWGWITPYGQVNPVLPLPPGIPDSPLVMAEDHSLTVLMPFVKTYLPNASVLPILLKSNATNTELSSLVDILSPLLTSRTLVMVSTDFSHYLSPELALAKDEETLVAIVDRNLTQIKRFNNSNLDSPNSLLTLLMLLPDTQLSVFGHTHAGVIVGNPNAATTTYYFLNFYAEK